MTVITQSPLAIPYFAIPDGNQLNILFGNPEWSTEYNITAKAGGGQTSGYQLTMPISHVSTVASGNDSVKLPASVAGMVFIVVNAAAANTLKLYGTSPDTINGVATGTGISVAAGTTVVCFCPVAGKWFATNGAAGGGAGSFTTLTASGATTLNAGVALGSAVANVVGFYGATGTSQRASSNQASTNIAVSASFGATQLAVIQEIMNTLTALGAWKGAA